jgi:hypothetical protein
MARLEAGDSKGEDCWEGSSQGADVEARKKAAWRAVRSLRDSLEALEALAIMEARVGESGRIDILEKNENGTCVERASSSMRETKTLPNLFFKVQYGEYRLFFLDRFGWNCEW